MRDGTLDEELTILEPHTSPVDAIKQGIGQLCSYVSMQAEMAVYDTIHRTNYRSIRNALVAEKRNREHEAAIGLERV